MKGFLRHGLLAMAAFAVMALAGCGTGAPPANTLRIAMENDPNWLDPANSYDTNSIQFARVLYRGLVDYDDKANVANEVARERRLSPDGKRYWFKLRDDVYFHSGRRVTAEDFRFALERVLDPATASDGLSIYTMIDGAEEFSKDRALPPAKRNLQHIRGIEVKGEDEITYVLKKPDATFINWLAMPFAYAVPRDRVLELDAQGSSLSQHPDGCGPFMLKEWVRDGWLKFQRNPRYFRPELPRCDGIDVKVGVSTTLQMMLFEQGKIDILSLTEAYPPEFLRLTRDPKWQPYLQNAPMMDIRYVCMNNELPPFDNVLVRRAMNYAIDRAKIASFLTGRASLAHGLLPPGMPAYNPKLFQYTYDPDKARQLLKQAGYRDQAGDIVLWYPNNQPWYELAAQSIQANLAAVGMSISLKKVTYSELKTAAGKRRNIKLCMIGWLQDFPDPSNFLDVLLNGKNRPESSSNNRAFYSNPQVNKLLDDAAVEQYRAKRLRMYQQAEEFVVQDAPWVFLHHTQRYVLHQPWITGYTLHPMWSERFEYVGVNRGTSR